MTNTNTITDGSRRFGGVREKQHTDGTVVHLAYYANPKQPKRRVYRSFDTRARAMAWLDDERIRVDMYRRGLADWTAPKERDRAAAMAGITFADWADQWMDRWGGRTRTGEPLAPSTLRRKRLLLRRLKAVFGRIRLDAVDARMVSAWLDGCDLAATPRREAYIMLRAIMRAAVAPPDGSTPLLERSPCVAPVPAKHLADKDLVAELSQDDIRRLADAMPAYTRISIHVMVAFGLRIGEMCALRVGDFDLERRMLTIRHSIRRGPDDTGPVRLGAMKTRGSMATMPIPERLIPKLVEHIGMFCHEGPDAQLLNPLHGGVMSDRTLRGQFDRAAVRMGRPELTPHMLRATAISRIIHEGGELKDAQLFARHADPTVTIRYYAKSRGMEERARLAAMSYDDVFSPGRSRDQLNRELAELERRADRLRTLLAR